MPAINGEQYKRRINELNTAIWFDGEKVKGNIGDHPAFRGVIQTQAALYDLQHRKSELMTFPSETTSNRIGLSYLIPKSKEDLIKRRTMIQEWARFSGGLMGRSPDYMNTVLAAFAASLDVLKSEPNCFPERLSNFYEYAREHDLSFTHTFVNPQNNRSRLAFLEEDMTNARIIKKVEEGMIVRGAKLLATQGGMTDELLVFSAPGVQENCQSYGFSIPSDTKGLTFACRSSFAEKDSPLSSRFEEMDAVVMFDDVLVPWERVFLFENIRAATNLYIKGKFVPFTLHQIVSRQMVKAEFILGVAHEIVEEINIGDYQHVQAKVVEIVKGLESIKALLHYAEQEAEADENGVMVPSRQPLYVAINQFQELYPRFTEIIQLLGASGLVTLPTEKDFQSPIGEDLNHYLRTIVSCGKEKVALFRLAWDLTMSSFGSRQTLYERFFFGDPIRLSQTIYQMYDEKDAVDLVHHFLHKKS